MRCSCLSNLAACVRPPHVCPCADTPALLPLPPPLDSADATYQILDDSEEPQSFGDDNPVVCPAGQRDNPPASVAWSGKGGLTWSFDEQAEAPVWGFKVCGSGGGGGGGPAGLLSHCATAFAPACFAPMAALAPSMSNIEV